MKNNKIITPEDVLKKGGCNVEIPNMVNLAIHYGFRVRDFHFSAESIYQYLKQEKDSEFIRGFILFDEETGVLNKKNTLVVERDQRIEHKKFAAAYLLSKYILDNPNSQYVEFVVENNYDKEVLAFCRDLLIPNKFYKNFRNLDIVDLSLKYKVPDFIAASKIKKYGGR